MDYENQFRIKIKDGKWDENVTLEDIENYMKEKKIEFFSSACLLYALNKGNTQLQKEIRHFNKRMWENLSFFKKYHIMSAIKMDNNLLYISLENDSDRNNLLSYLSNEYNNEYKKTYETRYTDLNPYNLNINSSNTTFIDNLWNKLFT